MKTLITGGAGFIGSHLAEALVSAGDRVTVLDDLSTGSRGNLAPALATGACELVVGDVTDTAHVRSAATGKDRIFHLAAAVGVRLIVENPTRTLGVNLTGTEAVLAAAAETGARVLLASTSEVYGKSTALPFREDADLVLGPTCRPRWSYAASKIMDEFLALAWREQRGVSVVIPRLFNVVGPRQTGRYGMVVPRLVGQALAGGPLTVYGSGRQTRCFLHVRDLVPALMALMESKEAEGQVVNLGSGTEISIEDLARTILHVTESKADIRHVSFEDAYGQGFEDMDRRVPDLTRAQDLIGFRATVDIETIIRDVAAAL